MATRFRQISLSARSGKGYIKISSPVIITRADHPISRAQISENALRVLNRLRDAGYDSHLVGGCVRDLMLGREPKDFDVVTNAHPEHVRRLFRNARLIGRRFRLAHVRFGREIIEVATYRATPREEDESAGQRRSEKGRILQDNVFGNQEEDALRRDFTVNALYYSINDFSVIDYVGGVEDLKRGVLRVIDEPETRFREDPVRMLRAVRFAAKLGFRIDPATAAPIRDLAPLLLDVPPARLFEEVLKLFHSGSAVETYEQLRHYRLFGFLFPLTEKSLEKQEGNFPITLLPRALANTDLRVNGDKPVSPAFLFATILWEPVRLAIAERVARGQNPDLALQPAAEEVLREQARRISIPKRFSAPMREIWTMQSRFERRQGKRAWRLFHHPRFRAAYDFLLLLVETGEAPKELAEWWTRFQEVDEEGRRAMIGALPPVEGRKRKRRRRTKKRAQPVTGDKV